MSALSPSSLPMRALALLSLVVCGCVASLPLITASAPAELALLASTQPCAELDVQPLLPHASVSDVNTASSNGILKRRVYRVDGLNTVDAAAATIILASAGQPLTLHVAALATPYASGILNVLDDSANCASLPLGAKTVVVETRASADGTARLSLRDL